MSIGIASVAHRTGLSQDTLRWYEKQGLIPVVDRGPDGRRRYDEATLRLIELLVRLRRTGMPVSDMRQFATLLAEGAASHGRRAALLRSHRHRLVAAIEELHTDLAAVDDKIAHYEQLIAAGLDCTGQSITDPVTRAEQRNTHAQH